MKLVKVSLVKSSALAVIASLAMSTAAGAAPLNSSAASSITEQGNIAQRMQRSRFDATRTRPYLDEMIMLHMQMVDAAQRAIESQDSTIRTMAQETIKSSNAEIDRMIDLRRKMFLENPDKG